MGYCQFEFFPAQVGAILCAHCVCANRTCLFIHFFLILPDASWWVTLREIVKGKVFGARKLLDMS